MCLVFTDDTCVTLQEYLSVHSCPVADQLFAHYDHNSDGCLKIADMSEEFHLIDHSGRYTEPHEVNHFKYFFAIGRSPSF